MSGSLTAPLRRSDRHYANSLWASRCVVVDVIAHLMPEQRLPERAAWRHHRFIVVGQSCRSHPDRLLAAVLVLQVHRGADSDPVTRNLPTQVPEIGQQLADLSDPVADPLQLLDPLQDLSLICAVTRRVTVNQAGNQLLFSLTQRASLGLQTLFIRRSACPLASLALVSAAASLRVCLSPVEC